MKSISFLFAVAAVGLSFATKSHATLLAYEPFNYGVGSLTGATGGTGFTGGYTAAGTGSGVSTPGYSYSTLPVAGNKADFADGNNGEFRTPTSSPDAQGTTLYISFISQITGTAGYAGLSLFQGATENLYLGKPNAIAFLGIDTKTSGVVPTAVTAATNAFQVYRIDFLATSAVISLYVNPALGTEPVVPTIVATKAVAFTFDQFRFQSGGGVTGSIDEIRFGTTYADVAPVPEASTTCLGGSMLGLAFLRRRRVS